MTDCNNSILGDISARQFLHEYWQKKPCLIKQAIPDYRCPISPEELAGLACDESSLSRLVTQDMHDENKWQVQYGPFTETIFTGLPDSHWSLLVSQVEQFIPEVNSLLSRFNFLPSWRLDDVMISYATRFGSVGPHLDSYDVFLLQGMGQRRWLINPDDYDESHFITDTDLRIIDDFKAKTECILSPGDMLYLPPGVAHHGIAENPCMTLSIGFRAPRSSELVQHFIDDVIDSTAEDIRFSDAQRMNQEHNGEVSAEDLDRILMMMQKTLSDETVIHHWFGKFITESTAATEPLTEPLSTENFRQLLADKNVLYRVHGIRASYIHENETVELFIHGEQLSMPGEHLDIAQLITVSTCLYAQDIFNHADYPVLIDLLKRLYELGYYFFDDE